MDDTARTELDVLQRDRLVAALLSALQATVPGSQALPRGSLADGRADVYSDVDLVWDVPDAAFASAAAQLPVVLAQVGPVASFLRLAEQRVGLVGVAAATPERLLRLVNAVVAQDSSLASLAADIRSLIAKTL